MDGPLKCVFSVVCCLNASNVRHFLRVQWGHEGVGEGGSVGFTHDCTSANCCFDFVVFSRPVWSGVDGGGTNQFGICWRLLLLSADSLLWPLPPNPPPPPEDSQRTTYVALLFIGRSMYDLFLASGPAFLSIITTIQMLAITPFGYRRLTL